MKSERININSKIGSIVGIIDVPENVIDPKRAVLVLHGSDGSKMTAAVQIAKAFNDGGFVTLRIDMWGFGESDGDWGDKTITSGVESIQAAVEYLVQSGYTKVAVFGTSFSGTCALCAAPLLPFVDTLILRSANPDYFEKLNEKYTESEIADWKKKGYIKHKNGKNVSYKLYEDAKKYNGYAIAKNVSAQVLLLHAALDNQISIEQVKRLEDNLGQSVLVVYENAKHGLSDEKSFEDLLKRSVLFIS